MSNKAAHRKRRLDRQARRRRKHTRRREQRRNCEGAPAPASSAPGRGLQIFTAWFGEAEAKPCACPICDFLANYGLESDENGIATIPPELFFEYELAMMAAERYAAERWRSMVPNPEPRPAPN